MVAIAGIRAAPAVYWMTSQPRTCHLQPPNFCTSTARYTHEGRAETKEILSSNAKLHSSSSHSSPHSPKKQRTLLLLLTIAVAASFLHSRPTDLPHSNEHSNHDRAWKCKSDRNLSLHFDNRAHQFFLRREARGLQPSSIEASHTSISRPFGSRWSLLSPPHTLKEQS